MPYEDDQPSADAVDLVRSTFSDAIADARKTLGHRHDALMFEEYVDVFTDDFGIENLLLAIASREEKRADSVDPGPSPDEASYTTARRLLATFVRRTALKLRLLANEILEADLECGASD